MFLSNIAYDFHYLTFLFYYLKMRCVKFQFSIICCFINNSMISLYLYLYINSLMLIFFMLLLFYLKYYVHLNTDAPNWRWIAKEKKLCAESCFCNWNGAWTTGVNHIYTKKGLGPTTNNCKWGNEISLSYVKSSYSSISPDCILHDLLRKAFISLIHNISKEIFIIKGLD